MAKKSMKQRKSRSSRKTYRKNRREIIGGFIAPVNMGNPVMAQSLAQGQNFASLHAGQHGGVADYPTSVSAGPFLSGSMASQAGVAGLDSKWAEIAGMRDQAGGKRRKHRKVSRKTKKSKKSRKASKKSRKASKKSRKASKKSRKVSKKSRKVSRKSKKSRKSRKSSHKQRGGVAGTSDSYMLLSGSLASKAEAGMSSDWALAKDPMAFAPK